MTTTLELLTKEEERVWLATYEASLNQSAGIKRSLDVAMESVREWRKLLPATPAADTLPSKDALTECQRALDDLRGVLEGRESAQADAEQREAISRLTVERDEARHDRNLALQRLHERIQEVGRLTTERNSLQEDLAAMQERLRASEESSAASHKDLAAVRERLKGASQGVHIALQDRDGAKSPHKGVWSECPTAICRNDRRAAGLEK